MKQCLSAKPASGNKSTAQQDKMKQCAQQAKGLKGAAYKAKMKSCLSTSPKK